MSDPPTGPMADARGLARRLGALRFADVVWLFGSAARGTANFASDLDLAISAPHADASDWAWVAEVIERAPVLRRVDAVCWEQLPPSDPLRASILCDRVMLREREPGLSERADDFAFSHPLLLRALARLREDLALLDRDPDNEILRDATVQRFEFSTEQVWKTLRHALRERGVAVGASPKVALTGAATEGWVKGAPKPWTDIIDDRNRTSQTYKKEIADDVLSRVPAHLVRMEALAARLPGLVA